MDLEFRIKPIVADASSTLHICCVDSRLEHSWAYNLLPISLIHRVIYTNLLSIPSLIKHVAGCCISYYLIVRQKPVFFPVIKRARINFPRPGLPAVLKFICQTMRIAAFRRWKGRGPHLFPTSPKWWLTGGPETLN